MTPQEGVIFLVSADAALTQQLINELVAAGRHYQLPLAISVAQARKGFRRVAPTVILLDESDRKSTRLNSSHLVISYAVFCLKKKNIRETTSYGRPNNSTALHQVNTCLYT